MSSDDYARAIIGEGQQARSDAEDILDHPVINERGIKIALATALVESNLVMYANNGDPDSLNYPHEAISSDANSVGLFQQRAPWWGTVADRMDPARSAAMFYHALSKLDYNGPQSPGSYAQAVQQSAFPDRYDDRFAEAADLYDQLSGSASAPSVPRPDFTETDELGRNANFSGRGGDQPTLWLIHTQEPGTDAYVSAQNLADFLASTAGGANPVSYHYSIGQTPIGAVEVVDVGDTDEESWSVLDANAYSINACFAGSSVNWSRAEWLDRMGNAIDVAAYLAVQDCRKYGISIKVIEPPYNSDPPGISDHAYVTEHLGIGTHSDVGPNFPWDVFTAAVNKYANGEEDDMALINGPSRSIYRQSNDDIGPGTEIDYQNNGMAHEATVERLALQGEPESLRMVRAVAEGKSPVDDLPEWAAARAQTVLNQIKSAS